MVFPVQLQSNRPTWRIVYFNKSLTILILTNLLNVVLEIKKRIISGRGIPPRNNALPNSVALLRCTNKDPRIY